MDVPFVKKTGYQDSSADALEGITGKKLEDLCLTTHNMDLTFVKKMEYRDLTADVEIAEVSLPLGFTGKKLDQCPTTLNLDSTFDKKTEYQVLTAGVETAYVETAEVSDQLQMDRVCEMNPEFFTTDSIACASCEFIDRVVVETLAFFALPD